MPGRVPDRVQQVLRTLMTASVPELCSFIATMDTYALTWAQMELRTVLERMRWESTQHSDRLIAASAFLRLIERVAP